MPGSIQMPRIGYEQEQLVSQELSQVFSSFGAAGRSYSSSHGAVESRERMWLPWELQIQASERPMPCTAQISCHRLAAFPLHTLLQMPAPVGHHTAPCLVPLEAAYKEYERPGPPKMHD